MSYRNRTTITCPNCGAIGEDAVCEFQPMAALAKGRVSMWRDENNEELQEEGKIKCEKCETFFLYKFSAKVQILTAKLPIFS